MLSDLGKNAMPDLFNEKSKDWDTNDRVRNLSSAIGSAILKQITFNDSMHVMDFGAGTGLISSHIAPLVEKIVAVDTSEAMLAKLASKPEFHGKVEAVCQNILDDSLDARFDLIVSVMAMHHVQDTQKLMQKFAEHLKPGAMVALADLDKEDGSFHPEGTEGVFHFGFERQDLQSTLEENGFKNINYVTAHTLNSKVKSFPIFLLVAEKG